MPHQCVKCGKFYEDAAKELLSGCSCGGKFFFFMKQQDITAVKTMTVKLSTEDKEQMERDALEMIGDEQGEKPVVLDLESIRMSKPGKFEIDLVDLFKGAPLVYKLEDGKYVIDLGATFKSDMKDEE